MHDSDFEIRRMYSFFVTLSDVTPHRHRLRERDRPDSYDFQPEPFRGRPRTPTEATITVFPRRSRQVSWAYREISPFHGEEKPSCCDICWAWYRVRSFVFLGRHAHGRFQHLGPPNDESCQPACPEDVPHVRTPGNRVL